MSVQPEGGSVVKLLERDLQVFRTKLLWSETLLLEITAVSLCTATLWLFLALSHSYIKIHRIKINQKKCEISVHTLMHKNHILDLSQGKNQQCLSQCNSA